MTSFRIEYEFLESGPESKMFGTLEIQKGLDLKFSIGITDSKAISVFLDWNELIARGQDEDYGQQYSSFHQVDQQYYKNQIKYHSLHFSKRLKEKEKGIYLSNLFSDQSIKSQYLRIINSQKKFKLMHKPKKESQLQSQKHSRNPSSQKQRDSHPRLTICVSPKVIQRKGNYYQSNPNSLQKKKPKAAKKKLVKNKKLKQQATIETISTSGEQHWKQHLKLTFRARKPTTKDITLRNNSLKCMEELTPIDSYASLINTFPVQDKKASVLGNKQRIYIIDWLSFIAAFMLLRKNTLHLSIAFIDAYADHKGVIPSKLQTLGAAALLLAVKQQQRGSEGEVLMFLSTNDCGITKQEIIKVQNSIVLTLSFKLNFSTLTFWFDYFSQKWDKFPQQPIFKEQSFSLKQNDLVKLRSPEGLSYKHYRQSMQLLDCLLMHPSARKHDFPKLALAVLYLVARVQTQSRIQEKQSKQSYQKMRNGFYHKASPIFRDRYHFNEIFNYFVAETCDFQISEIMHEIRIIGEICDVGFTYQIDGRIYESAINYQQFLRFSSHSEHIRNYFLSKSYS